MMCNVLRLIKFAFMIHNSKDFLWLHKILLSQLNQEGTCASQNSQGKTKLSLKNNTFHLVTTKYVIGTLIHKFVQLFLLVSGKVMFSGMHPFL